MRFVKNLLTCVTDLESDRLNRNTIFKPDDFYFDFMYFRKRH